MKGIREQTDTESKHKTGESQGKLVKKPLDEPCQEDKRCEDAQEEERAKHHRPGLKSRIQLITKVFKFHRVRSDSLLRTNKSW